MARTDPSLDAGADEGVRERRRRETRQRIAQAGQRLFLANGYEATTLDDIAAEAGISRRAFFSYFRSKDDILFAWQTAGWESFNADLLKTSPDVKPIDAVRDLLVRYTSAYTTEEMTTIDGLMRSSEALLARKQTFYAEQEQALFATLCEVWRQPERRAALRMVAMVSIGATRLAIQAWNDQPEPRGPMADFVRDAFERLKSEL